MKIANWERLPQESNTGQFFFAGAMYITQGVNALRPAEILFIYWDLRAFVKENPNGVDYLQVYIDRETNRRLYFIDNLSKSMIDSGDYKPEDNYCTLLFSEEY